ncbi:MAG: homocysteine S-methyltransferase family protein [Holophagales bacterium]|nr:homocysteine S-methyltransferase family protein [Holophagales bacterium]MYH24236.1 homocysteine S-methyltransferase family protein [Holophagales bacterium]
MGIVEEWLACLDRGEILLLDGGTGTELERRGVPMDSAAWCGTAALEHQDAIRDLHEDYIRAGADAIITNTFATHRPLLEAAGLGDKVGLIVRRAVEAALEARERAGCPGVLVAGSMSTMPANNIQGGYPPDDEQMAAYREQCGLLAEAGVDLIALEMMQFHERAVLAFRAAKETGLPVWLGVSARKDPDTGAITPFNWPDESFEELLDTLIPLGPQVVHVMHSEIAAVPEAVAMVQERWDGPVGVYPESGYFTMPNWNFVDVIDPAHLLEEARGWVAAGVQIVGGCCGLGPEHIRALGALRGSG